MVRQIKATSIKSSPLCEEKHEWASACEPRSQGSRARENRVTPFTGAATERHQSENAQRFLLDLSAEFVSRDYETTLKRLATRTPGLRYSRETLISRRVREAPIGRPG
jgi:hypothetical protein